MEINNLPATVGQAFKYQSAATEQDLAEAERRLDSMLDQRTKLVETGMVGALTLNGASIVAVFTALQVGGDAMAALGFDIRTIATSLFCYIIGAVNSVLSVFVETNRLSVACADQYAKVASLRRVSRTLASPATQAAVERLGAEIEEANDMPVLELAYSKAGNWFRAGAGSFWLAGTFVLLLQLMSAAL